MTERRLRMAVAVLSIFGLGISVYLTVERLRGRDPACVVGGSCGAVQQSEYAELAGIPVPVVGIVGYTLLLISALLAGNPGRLLGLFAGVVAVGFSAWLTFVELEVIEAICTWCVASATIVTIATAAAVWRVMLGQPEGENLG